MAETMKIDTLYTEERRTQERLDDLVRSKHHYQILEEDVVNGRGEVLLHLREIENRSPDSREVYEVIELFEDGIRGVSQSIITHQESLSKEEVRLQRVLDDIYYERQKLSLGDSAGKEEENGKG
ncbi:hypothetical protein [Streptococcus suis]|uniref:hypothetical protein n=1 Tax=Streptococcus suis TaxID=1307 RepID=UPI000CF5B4C8|nr:hypothetical protein [Streptococcus suis]